MRLAAGRLPHLAVGECVAHRARLLAHLCRHGLYDGAAGGRAHPCQTLADPLGLYPRVFHRCGGAISGRIVVLDRAAGKGAHEMATTVADVMVATLRASGVQRIYGIPGDSLNGFTDAMRRD